MKPTIRPVTKKTLTTQPVNDKSKLTGFQNALLAGKGKKKGLLKRQTPPVRKKPDVMLDTIRPALSKRARFGS